MSEKVFLFLAGNPGSGKSETAQHLADQYDFEVYRPSGLIRAYAESHNMPLYERRDYIAAHLQMLDEHGQNYVVETMSAIPADRVCVAGERVMQHVEGMRKYGAKVMALWCPLSIRHQRCLKRGEIKDKLDIQAFFEDEAREYQSKEPPYPRVLDLMQTADYFIDASRPLDEMLTAVDSYVEPLLTSAS
jgi:cytidylate kinase